MTLYETCLQTAIVIKIGDRYFIRCTKKSVISAWSLAGARLFLPDRFDLNEVVKELEIRKKKFKIITIGINDEILSS